MFDVSFTELMVIGVIALVVLGPERLPKVARTLGHLMGRAQRSVNDVKADIQREIELDELRKFKQSMDNAAGELRSSLAETENSLQGAAQSIKSEIDTVTQQAQGALDLNTPQTTAPASEPAPEASAPETPAPAPTKPADATTSTTP